MPLPLRHAFLSVIVALSLAAFFAPSVLAWGDESHRAIVRGATTALPEVMRPFFQVNREALAAHSIEPDYIPSRTLAQRGEHFLDIDAYGSYPFKEFSRDRAALEKAHDEETVAKRGLLPWAVQREFDRLVAAFAAQDWNEVCRAAGHLSHFVADAHMPMHATVNYDGQMSGNRGIHIRIEVGLAPRYHNSPFVRGAKVEEIGDPVDWAIAEIRRSWSLHHHLLQADSEACAAAPVDSDDYYAELDRRIGDLIERRHREAASAVASFFAAAWKKAGHPALPPSRVSVILHEAKGDGALPAVSAMLTQALDPFDAIAVAQGNAPRRARDLRLNFDSAKLRVLSSRLYTTTTGEIREALTIAERGLAAFPKAQRIIVLVTDGWEPSPEVMENARRLKAQGIHTLLVPIGEVENPAEIEQFTALSGARRLPPDAALDPDALKDIIAKELRFIDGR